MAFGASTARWLLSVALTHALSSVASTRNGAPGASAVEGEMIRLTKRFEVGADQMEPEQMREIAREKVAEWTKELWASGYRKIEKGIDLEIITPEDADPRYLIFEATLTASKEY